MGHGRAMRVRVPNLLGKDVHEASIIEMPDEFTMGGTKKVVEVRAEGRDPLRMDWASADEIEIVEATDDERAVHEQMLERLRKV
jgi:hypothetical protein